MKTKRKTKTTEITVEKSEVFVVRKCSNVVVAWCEQCNEEVRMITPEQAASMNRVSTRVIYALLETGRIHFTETATGLLLVCLNSVVGKNAEKYNPLH